MMSIKYISIKGLALASLLLGGSVQAADLNITLTHVKSSKGMIRLAIFASESTFDKTPERTVSIAAQQGDMMILVDDLAAGEYAVMLYQDLDDNQKLDTNLIGMPREPWGASLGGQPVFGPPDWQATHFSVPESGTQISIALR